jgi:hypothetical protein
MVVTLQFREPNVGPDVDIPEESEPRSGGGLVEAPGHVLDLLVIGGDAITDKAVGGRKTLEEVDADGWLAPE